DLRHALRSHRLASHVAALTDLGHVNVSSRDLGPAILVSRSSEGQDPRSALRQRFFTVESAFPCPPDRPPRPTPRPPRWTASSRLSSAARCGADRCSSACRSSESPSPWGCPATTPGGGCTTR